MHILTEHGWHTLVNYFIEKLGGEVKIEWDELKKQPAVILAHSNPDFILFTHPCFKEIKGNYKKGIILNFNAFLYRGKTAVNKKEIIQNANDDDYENIALYLSEDFIETAHNMLQMIRKAVDEEMIEL